MKNISELKSSVLAGVWDTDLTGLYGTDHLAEQKARYAHLCDEALRRYGDRPACFVSAPGRTEVGGNHTDHQLGRVLAAAIDLDIAAVVVPSDDPFIVYESDSFHVRPVDLGDLSVHEEERNTTESLIRGIAAAFVSRGLSVHGFCCYAESDVLPGSGMSSSAAFEVLIGTILSNVFNGGSVSPVEIAKIGQFAENVYFMKGSGLMDQMACSVGGFVAIDFYDPNSPVISHVDYDLDAHGYDLIITDCRASHADLSDEYSLMPQEMKEAAAVMGEEVLSRLSVSDLLAHASEIREKCGDRAFLRSYHFFRETERAEQEKTALEKGDLDRFLSLVNESGHSSFMYLQNVKANGIDRQQSLAVGLAVSEEILRGCGAWRVHGGGLAGTIQAFSPKGKTPEFIRAMESLFGKGCSHIVRIRAVGGKMLS